MKRSAVINKGYWIRVFAFRSLIEQFLSNGDSDERQILSLGAGFDSAPFRYMSKHEQFNPFQWFEIDFRHVVETKANVLKHDDALSTLMQQQNAKFQSSMLTKVKTKKKSKKTKDKVEEKQSENDENKDKKKKDDDDDNNVFGVVVESDRYKLLAGDLRNSIAVKQLLIENGFDFEKPTLILCE